MASLQDSVGMSAEPAHQDLYKGPTHCHALVTLAGSRDARGWSATVKVNLWGKVLLPTVLRFFECFAEFPQDAVVVVADQDVPGADR